MHIYNMTYKHGETLQNILFWPLLFGIGLIFQTIVVQGYNLYQHIYGEDIWQIVECLKWVVISYFQLLLIVWPAECIKRETTKCGSSLHSVVPHLAKSGEVNPQVLVRSSLQLIHEPILFSAAGFFDIDYTLAYNITGAALMYLVILMQFDHVANAEDEKKVVKRGLLGLGHGYAPTFGSGYASSGFGGLGLHSGFGSSGLGLSGLGLGHGHHVTHTVSVNKVAIPVPHPVPVPVERTVHVPYKVAVPYAVDRPYAVHVPKPYPVPVVKHIPVPVDKPYPVHVPVPVKVPVVHKVAVPVPAPYPVAVHKAYPVPVHTPVFVKHHPW